jgi:hypothetical protein
MSRQARHEKAHKLRQTAPAPTRPGFIAWWAEIKTEESL